MLFKFTLELKSWINFTYFTNYIDYFRLVVGHYVQYLKDKKLVFLLQMSQLRSPQYIKSVQIVNKCNE